MEIKTEGIVLQAIDYKDNDKLLTIFSPTLGCITAGIRGVKKPKARLAFSAQPFCFAEYILAEKGGRYTVTGAYLHESFFDLRTDVERFYGACATAEICRVLAIENERHESLFIAFIACLKALCLEQADTSEAVLSFMVTALYESGYPLDLGYLEEYEKPIGDKIYFDFANGRFCDLEDCVQGERASISTYHTLRKCAGLDFDESKTAGGTKRALRLLRAYLSEKTETRFDNLGELIRMQENG